MSDWADIKTFCATFRDGEDNKIKKAFCILPWNHLEIKPNGTVKICCVASRQISIEKKPVSVGKNSFDEIWNSQYMQNVRSAMLDGRRLPECLHCTRHENSNLETPSLRHWQNREWGLRYNTNLDGLIEWARKKGTRLDQAPTYLQLSLGNECNLKCRMCCSDYSNQIEKDPVHSKWVGTSAYPPRDQATSWFESDAFFAELIPDPSRLEKLYVTGGEPMMSVRLQQILDQIVEAGRSDNCDIVLNTNGTVANLRLLQRLTRFRNAQLGCSIDAYGQYFEYIRYPGKWSVIEKTLNKFRDFPKCHVSVNPTIQAYNAMNIAELFQFCDERGLICTPQIMYGPEYLAMLVMPVSAREVAADRLRAYMTSSAANDVQRTNRNYCKVIVDYLEQASVPSNIAQLTREFAIFTNDLDRSRGQDFKTTHAELYEHFIASEFGWCDEVRHLGDVIEDKRRLMEMRRSGAVGTAAVHPVAHGNKMANSLDTLRRVAKRYLERRVDIINAARRRGMR
jgi:MoaA/NifB/PqqE/SkfB family radical SAM enzyme